MIVKIKTHKRATFKYMLGYMMNDKDRLRGSDGRSFVITHNMRGKSIDGWAEQFKENEKNRIRKRRKDGVYFNHEILSWHKNSTKHLSPEKLEKMIREYIKLRNPKSCYVACAHHDKNHVHVHICSSGIDRTGKAMRMSRQELLNLKKNIQQFQIDKFPELSHSVVRHGRKSKAITTDKEIQYKLRTGKQTKKEELLSILNDCQKHSKNQEDFFARLKGCKLQTYVRGGRIYGVVFENRKYRFKTLGIEIEQYKMKQKNRKKELQDIRRRNVEMERNRGR